MKSYRRKKSIVHRQSQSFIGRMVAGYLALFTGALVLSFFVPVLGGLASSDPYSTCLKEAGSTFLLDPLMWVLLALTISLIGLHGAMRARAISGPIFALGRAIDNLAAGDFSRDLILREDDVLHDIADRWNIAIAQQRSRLSDLQAARAELQSALEQLKSQSEGQPAAAAEALERAVQAVAKQADVLSELTLLPLEA
ncbi:MAG: methyl-accepting chemotaxis protein [Candidatus Schekmanbacteria bacterium]|nr:methyl-accepting chemotaxis protein [Candidatus Schekmanbacteria bacterium]